MRLAAVSADRLAGRSGGGQQINLVGETWGVWRLASPAHAAGTSRHSFFPRTDPDFLLVHGYFRGRQIPETRRDFKPNSTSPPLVKTAGACRSLASVLEFCADFDRCGALGNGDRLD